MKFPAFVPIVLSLLVLGAHFMRYGSMLGAAAAVVLSCLLLLQRPWVARLVQFVLVLGTLEWLRTLVMLARWRAAQGEPLVRMVIILGVVAAVTFCSALLFQTGALKRIYGLEQEEEQPE